ncbi:MAG TPA: SDR family oxidoreductase [Blastocatellia bacterium]|nr:SDR family oxidoreductase [Blastocatellia bacterium]
MEIAIIGMAGRFPGAKNLREFWRNLRDGVESISFFTDEELISFGVDRGQLSDPGYVKASGFLDDVEMFDAAFFGYSPREAELIDPQQRIFLECAWEALENAGHSSESYDGLIGVFGGVGTNTYLFNIYSNPQVINSIDVTQLTISNEKDYLTTRVSYKLDLQGPSVDVQSACSTALVGVHLARQSLLHYECDMALAGGILVNAQKSGYLYSSGGIMSPDGHCRTFDAGANGSVGGNGVGIVVLKRLEDAIADGDHIRAVIKGSALNNDGSLRAGYTAPGVDGQAEVIVRAQAIAEVDPESITFLEAHGTATALGDPIEFAACTKAFRAATGRKNFCAIGSVKTNVGHTGEAAGIAGLIKTVLALEHGEIPPSLHFKEPNPQIDLANSPFYVNTALVPWEAGETPRRAGVNSFGLGGTNVHVIVEEAPAFEDSDESRPAQLIILSAKSEAALEAQTDNLVEHLRQNPGLNLADIAYTLQTGRSSFSHRRMAVCRDAGDAIEVLSSRNPKRVFDSVYEKGNRPVVFMFSGLGDQYVDLARGLYQHEPEFREQVDLCSILLKPIMGLDLREVLYPEKQESGDAQSRPAGFDLRKALRRGGGQPDEREQKLDRTFIAQPALFVIEYALAKLLMKWGVTPQALIGFSLGEYVAACIAGVISLEDALKLVAQRAQMIQGLPSGAMLAVPLSEGEVRPMLGGQLSLSAISGDALCVVAGPEGAVVELEDRLREMGLVSRRLRTTHAFHSSMMRPIANQLTELVRSVSLSAPKIPYISNVTGDWITAEQAESAGYWADHMCEPVRFSDGIDELCRDPHRAMIEIGPGQSLGPMVLQQEKSIGRLYCPTLRHGYDNQPDEDFLLTTLGKLWLSGIRVDWQNFYDGERRRRVPLPPYPFERRRYWIEPGQPANDAAVAPKTAGKKADISEWFYLQSWKRSLPPKPLKPESLEGSPRLWVLLAGHSRLSAAVEVWLRRAGQEVVTVAAGERFDKRSEADYSINISAREDYDRLLAELCGRGKTPDLFVHLWSVTEDGSARSDVEAFNDLQERGYYSLLYLTQALAERAAAAPVQLEVVSNNLHDVSGDELARPEKATMLAACITIPQEHLNLSCRCIDVSLPGTEGEIPARLVGQVVSEILSVSPDVAVAYRGDQRWVQSFEPARLKAEGDEVRALRENGVYLLTGGLGGVGLLLAEYLARRYRARVVLLGRSPLLERSQWDQWLTSHDPGDPVSRRIAKIRSIESAGAEVMLLNADVSREEELRPAIDQIYERFGELNGVLHAAGIAVTESVSQISRAECQMGFRAKAYGLYALETALRGRGVDFCLLFSSNASILGGLGFFSYSAANIFMDAFASQRKRMGGMDWISANWDGWMLPEQADDELAIQSSISQLVMKPEESVEAFRRVVSLSTANHLVVSTGDLDERFDIWVKRESLRRGEESQQSGRPVTYHPRPGLQTAYVAPRDELEQGIAEIWQKLLGLESVGIHDPFFDLGGHSLLALQLFGELRNVYQVELPLPTIFEAPTIMELASIVKQRLEEMALMINELEALSDEEARMLLEDDQA